MSSAFLLVPLYPPGQTAYGETWSSFIDDVTISGQIPTKGRMLQLCQRVLMVYGVHKSQ